MQCGLISVGTSRLMTTAGLVRTGSAEASCVLGLLEVSCLVYCTRPVSANHCSAVINRFLYIWIFHAEPPVVEWARFG